MAALLAVACGSGKTEITVQELRDRIEEALQSAGASTADSTSGGLSTRTSLPALEPARRA